LPFNICLINSGTVLLLQEVEKLNIMKTIINIKNTIIGVFLGIVIIAAAAAPVSAQFTLSVGVSIHTAPPPLPVYSQPPCPEDGYLWTPGYWAWDDIDGYYWVPGVWLSPPMVGYLWTPGYWGYAGGIYGWHGGYWGTHVGFYGGVNYGYGYGGSGFYGGAWQGRSFRYNTAVLNVNTTVVHNTYIDRTVINNTVINNRASFNGTGGVTARPTAAEQAVARESHVQPTTQQFSHNQTAARDRNQFASVNHGRPAAAAMNRVGGQRFNPQGGSPAAVTPRPQGGNRAANNNPVVQTHSNPVVQTHSNPVVQAHNNPVVQTQTQHINRQPQNNRPAQARTMPQQPGNNPGQQVRQQPHPQQHPQPQARPQQQPHPQQQARPQAHPAQEAHHRER
jgi:hypothetical protein